MKQVLIISLLITLCFGINITHAPKVKAFDIFEPSELVTSSNTYTPKSLDQHIINQIPDSRSTAGSADKNIIFAEDGQSVAVIYNRFSGDPINFMQVFVAYSTDRGNTWPQYGPLSTFNARRTYPALDAGDDFYLTGRIHFVWNQVPQISGSYDSSPAFYAKEVMFPDGLITAARRLPNSGRRDVWMPCIGVRDSFVVITAMNNGTYLTTYDVYIWRSTDYGETWDTGRVFLPGPTQRFPPHFRFGRNGYMFFLWLQEVGNSRYWPYYCESFDYALTWTEPRPLWDTPPYPDMSNVTGWWYNFDCEVASDTPAATLSYSTGNYDYGEIWVYRPDSGQAGNWHFKGIKLVGGDSTAPQTYARFPTIAADDTGSLFIGYQAIFETPSDTGPDIGLFVRPAWKDTWVDWGMITNNRSDIEEKHLEFAHNAPIVETYPDDSVVIGMIYHDAADFPTTGNLYFDWFAIHYDSIRRFQEITGINQKNSRKLMIEVLPNPFNKLTRFTIPSNIGQIKLTIFDVTGKLVRTLISTNQKSTPNLIWDGRKGDGNKVNAGIYFYTATSGNNTYQGKIILTR